MFTHIVINDRISFLSKIEYFILCTIVLQYLRRVGFRSPYIYQTPTILKTHSQPSVTIYSTSMDSTNHSWKYQSLVESEAAKTLQYRERTMCILKNIRSSNSCCSRVYCIYHILFSLYIHPSMGSYFHTLASKHTAVMNKGVQISL